MLVTITPALVLGVPSVGAAQEGGEGWSYGLDVGLPRLQSGRLSVVADGDLGYQTGAFGGTLAAHFAQDSLRGGDVVADTDRATVDLDGSFRVATLEAFGFEARSELGGLFYRTFYSATDDRATSGGGFRFDDQETIETSWLGRGIARLAVVNPSDSPLHVDLSLGVGYQLERYSSSVFMASGTSAFDIEFSDVEFHTTSGSVLFVVDLEVVLQVMPQLVHLRLDSRASFYALSRSNVLYAFTSEELATPEQFTEAVEDVEQRQGVDVVSRLFVELPIFALIYLTPNAFLGLDYYRLGEADTLVPVVGVGFTE